METRKTILIIACSFTLLIWYVVLGGLRTNNYTDYPITSIQDYESCLNTPRGYQKWVVVEFNGKKHKACLNGAKKSNAGYDYARQYSSGLYVLYLTAETKRCLGK